MGPYNSSCQHIWNFWHQNEKREEYGWILRSRTNARKCSEECVSRYIYPDRGVARLRWIQRMKDDVRRCVVRRNIPCPAGNPFGSVICDF